MTTIRHNEGPLWTWVLGSNGKRNQPRMKIGLYLRQSFILLFGNGTAQLVNLASYVALARLYGPPRSAASQSS